MYSTRCSPSSPARRFGRGAKGLQGGDQEGVELLALLHSAAPSLRRDEESRQEDRVRQGLHGLKILAAQNVVLSQEALEAGDQPAVAEEGQPVRRLAAHLRQGVLQGRQEALADGRRVVPSLVDAEGRPVAHFV